MFLRFAFARRSRPVVLGEERFTRDEAARLRALRRRYVAYPDSFKLDVNFRRASFVRWLVEHGYLREGLERREETDASTYRLDKWSMVQRWT